MTRKCRREILTIHLDGIKLKIKCGEGGIDCGNCDKPDLYEKRVRNMGISVQEKNGGLEKLKMWLERLQGRCGWCFVTSGWEDCDHLFEECEELRESMSESYEEARAMVNYDQKSICWNCSWPADWCEYYSEGLACQEQDVVIVICLAAWGHDELRTKIKNNMKKEEFPKMIEYMRWLGMKKRFFDMNLSWGLFIFYMICEFVESEE